MISKVTSADALEEDSKPDTSDTEEEEWVPKASRRAKFSKMIHSFMNSSEPMLTFSNALTTFERFVDVTNIATAESDIAASSGGCYRCLFCGESFDSTNALNEHVMKSCDNVN